MKVWIKYVVSLWLLLLTGSTTLCAALPDDFNPSNPPEPNARFKVTVRTDENAYVSGGGTYRKGDQTWINTSSYNENAEFLYWTKNGVKYTEKQNFSYTVEDRSVEFVAVYGFRPVNPLEPSAPNQYRLFLNAILDGSATPAGSCSFNRTSGEKAEGGVSVWLCVYPSQGYQFKGWFCDGKKISESTSFYYVMPTVNTTMTARLVYSPTSPAEPGGTGQTGVANTETGDVNKDGVINTADAVMLINHFVAGKTSQLNEKAADVNTDGVINTADAVLIINKFVNNQ